MVVIQNIAGGDRYVVRSAATLARLGAAQPYGGWEVVRNDGLPADGFSREDVYRVLVWTRVAGRRPRTAREWRKVAAEAIAFGRRCDAD